MEFSPARFCIVAALLPVECMVWLMTLRPVEVCKVPEDRCCVEAPEFPALPTVLNAREIELRICRVKFLMRKRSGRVCRLVLRLSPPPDERAGDVRPDDGPVECIELELLLDPLLAMRSPVGINGELPFSLIGRSAGDVKSGNAGPRVEETAFLIQSGADRINGVVVTGLNWFGADRGAVTGLSSATA